MSKGTRSAPLRMPVSAAKICYHSGAHSLSLSSSGLLSLEERKKPCILVVALTRRLSKFLKLWQPLFPHPSSGPRKIVLALFACQDFFKVFERCKNDSVGGDCF